MINRSINMGIMIPASRSNKLYLELNRCIAKPGHSKNHHWTWCLAIGINLVLKHRNTCLMPDRGNSFLIFVMISRFIKTVQCSVTTVQHKSSIESWYKSIPATRTQVATPHVLKTIKRHLSHWQPSRWGYCDVMLHPAQACNADIGGGAAHLCITTFVNHLNLSVSVELSLGCQDPGFENLAASGGQLKLIIRWCSSCCLVGSRAQT